jgi:hypothetical protein
MDGLLFDRFRAMEELVFAQESARRAGARKRAEQYRAARPQSGRSGIKVKARLAPAAAARHEPQPFKSHRTFRMLDSELFEEESLREEKFLLESEISDLDAEVQQLRIQLSSLERVRTSIDRADRYFASHFRDASAETGKAVQQREQQDAILKLQKQSA